MAHINVLGVPLLVAASLLNLYCAFRCCIMGGCFWLCKKVGLYLLLSYDVTLT